MDQSARAIWPFGLAILCSACSSGGGGSVASAPPPVSEPPPPTPVALKSDQPFATIYLVASYASGDGPAIEVAQTDPSQDLVLHYDGASERYLITLPGLPEGPMAQTFVNDWVSEYDVVFTDGASLSARVALNRGYAPMGPEGQTLSYTGWGSWSAETGRFSEDGRSIRDLGTFAYGIPTAEGDVPVSGAASYTAAIHGGASWTSTGPVPSGSNALTGSVFLEFDFTNGTLAGSMDAYMSSNGFQEYEGALGTLTFADTVYAIGSTRFSGSFMADGATEPAGEFHGSFNGPQAAELMGQFRVPFEADRRLLWSDTNQIDHLTGTLSGLWIGGKD